MTIRSSRLYILSVLSIVCAAPAVVWAASTASQPRFTEQFNLSSCTWASNGKNDYFVLQPGYQAVFESRKGADRGHLQITVLNETRKVGGVETRIVEERETRNGELIEVSRNFFAICKETNDVFYFGEDVDMYKGGKITSHEGSWTAEGSARPGLFMPSRPLLGARFYQEIAPKVAMDRVEIVSDSELVKTPAGDFRDCVKTEETTPLEPNMRDYKVFARGVGLVKDGELLLTKYGSIGK